MFDSLKTFIILSIQEIMQIKSHILVQNNHLPSNQRAELLSIAIHRHLDQHLTGVDSDYRHLLKHTLLSATVAKHNYTITQLDVLESIGTLDLNHDVKTALAEKWLNASTDIAFSYEDLSNYIENQSLDGLFITPLPPLEMTVAKPIKGRLIALALCATLLIGLILWPKPVAQPSALTLPLNRYYEANTYVGLHALDRVYLIEAITKDALGTYDVSHQTLPFGPLSEPFPFSYQTFDYFAVKAYIGDTRKGLIGSSAHFNAIISLAKANDMDPLLLFAIIGQEQAFVPVDSYRATDVLNNPFNVFHSWMAFNTDLNESTQIAINTIKNRLKSLPKDESPFIWLNGIYAEDKNWHVGVQLIYQHLQAIGRENL